MNSERGKSEMDHNIAELEDLAEPMQDAYEPDFAPVLRRMARAAWHAKDYEAAEASAMLLIEQGIGNCDAWNMLGRIELVKGDVHKAIDFFAEAFVIRQDPVTAINLALAYSRVKNFDQALMYCAEAIVLDSTFLPAYIQQTAIYQERGQFDDAEAIVRRALQLHPGNDELLHALSLFELRRWCTPRSECPNCANLPHEGPCKRKRHAGDGWKHYEHRAPRLELAAKLDDYEEWAGHDLAGKTILVCGEQGIGDQIMFARYLPLLAELGGKIVLFTRPELARLFAYSFPGVQVVASDAELATIEPDYWVAIGSLAYRCGAGELATPYIYPRPSDTARFDGLLGPKTGALRVGLCWRGNPSHRYDEYRSMTWEEMAPIVASSGNCEFYSLQQGDKESGLPCLIDYCHDVADTVAAISNLDVVVSVDTAVLHLAGAMGKDTIALLPDHAEWRWVSSGYDNRWYPSVRCFRQQPDDGWPEVMHRVRFTLAADGAAIPGIRVALSGSSPSQIHQRSTETSRECRYGKMHYYANDHYIGRALELYGEYSQSEADLLRRVLKPGDVVIEAGANVGGLTVAMMEISCEVWAFEPQPEYHKLLERNTFPETQHLGGRCWPYQMALGNEETKINIAQPPVDHIHAPGWHSDLPGREVSQCRIDGIFERSRSLALIKIDVDGQEHDILKGAEKTIERCRPLLYVEYDKIECYPDMIPWIQARGYRIYQHVAPLFNPANFAGNPVNVFGSLVSSMLLCVPQERKDLRPSEWGLHRVTAERVAA